MMTLSEKAHQCPCQEKCPLETALELIGGKWKIQILCSLYIDGATRYSELKRKLRGISNTMLAACLKELERDGLVMREQFMEIPVRVEYRHSPTCDSLIPILGQLAGWGAQMMKAHTPETGCGSLTAGMEQVPEHSIV